MIKKIYILIVLFFVKIYTSFASLEDDILPWTDTIINEDAGDWMWIIASLLWYVKDTIFWLMMLVAIAVFLYIWAKLVMAKWNPEEFKKAIQSFIYAIVGMVFVWLAWALVVLVSWLNL